MTGVSEGVRPKPGDWGNHFELIRVSDDGTKNDSEAQTVTGLRTNAYLSVPAHAFPALRCAQQSYLCSARFAFCLSFV